MCTFYSYYIFFYVCKTKHFMHCYKLPNPEAIKFYWFTLYKPKHLIFPHIWCLEFSLLWSFYRPHMLDPYLPWGHYQTGQLMTIFLVASQPGPRGSGHSVHWPHLAKAIAPSLPPTFTAAAHAQRSTDCTLTDLLTNPDWKQNPNVHNRWGLKHESEEKGWLGTVRCESLKQDWWHRSQNIFSFPTAAKKKTKFLVGNSISNLLW